MDRGDGAGIPELSNGGPGHPDAHRQQQQSEHERRGIFIAMVAVLVLLIRLLLAVMGGDENNKVCEQIGKGMNSVGDQAL